MKTLQKVINFTKDILKKDIIQKVKICEKVKNKKLKENAQIISFRIVFHIFNKNYYYHYLFK